MTPGSSDSSRRSSRRFARPSRLTIVVALLVLTLAIASALAWQAHRAAQSHRDAAQKVLTDYVAFAGWEFSRAARRELDVTLDRWVNTISRTAASEKALPVPAGLDPSGTCGCGDLRARSLFRFSASDSDLEVTGEPLDAATRKWILDIAGNNGSYAGAHPHRVVRITDVGGRMLLVGAGRAHNRGVGGDLVAGFVADPAALNPPLARVIKSAPLLPPTLAGKHNDLVAVQVTTSQGFPIFAHPDRPETSGASTRGLLDDSVGSLAYQVALRADAADRLVIGGLPQSRLPVLLALLALTTALLMTAAFQLRREHQLAALRSDFVSSVSHELRTPLAQIRLFSETLLLGRVRSESEARRSLEIIQQESRRLTHLVENVLYFSRGERGNARLSIAPARLAELASEVIEAFQPLARSAQARVELHMRADVAAPVDPSAVRQILLNLLDNAVKYGRAHQTIVIAVEQQGADAVLAVEDEGPGIPPDARARIWQPYARLASAEASAIAGTGIGLAVVRDLAELHGGSARVEDRRGGGARFIVRLPGAMALDAVPDRALA
jgi:signal transduction histidine kinase